MKKQIYLDCAATTPVYKEVVKAMRESLIENYGNPSSTHELGEIATKLMTSAREKIAKEIGAKSSEIFFTSCATESNNIALGCLENKEGRNKIIISSIEHPSIEEVAKYLEKEKKYKVVRIPVNNEGVVDLDFLRKHIDSKTLLVSVMHVNNIVGNIQPIKEIGKICKNKGVLFHTDAVQSFGKLDIDVSRDNIDMLSASAHKIGGPKGVGLLYIKSKVKMKPFLIGGGQEKGIRSGTENVSGILGFSKALEIVKKTNKKSLKESKEKLIKNLAEIGATINSPKNSLDSILNFSVRGNAESIAYFLSNKGVYVSVGSACESKKGKEERVLKNMGLDRKKISGSLRVSFYRRLTDEEIKRIISLLKKSMNKTGVN